MGDLIKQQADQFLDELRSVDERRTDAVLLVGLVEHPGWVKYSEFIEKCLTACRLSLETALAVEEIRVLQGTSAALREVLNVPVQARQALTDLGEEEDGIRQSMEDWRTTL